MNPLIEVIAKKVKEQLATGESLIEDLQTFGWKDERPDRKEEYVEEGPGIEQVLADYDRHLIPAKARIPFSFISRYHQWYAVSLALVEANMLSRRDELVLIHQGNNKSSESSMLGYLRDDFMTLNEQFAMTRKIRQMMGIIGSVPNYLEGRLHDLELELAQAYVGQELLEAEVLLKAGHIRAAGAIAGVLLEGHLKLLCDRHVPPIKYGKDDGISKLNEKLKNEGVYDVAQWRKVQWMGDVRNKCDHAGTDDPRPQDIADLIAETRKFISLVVI